MERKAGVRTEAKVWEEGEEEWEVLKARTWCEGKREREGWWRHREGIKLEGKDTGGHEGGGGAEEGD